jgi:uncharacterized protein YjiS (DUF1127 family)
MSTTFDDTPPFSIALPARSADGVPQMSSWRAAAMTPWRVSRLWTARRCQRKALRDLAEQGHLLADIGLTRAQALHEAGKPFWRC